MPMPHLYELTSLARRMLEKLSDAVHGLERRILKAIDVIYAFVAQLEALAIALEVARRREGYLSTLYASRATFCDALIPMDKFLENALRFLGFKSVKREYDGQEEGSGITEIVVEMRRGRKSVWILFKCRTLFTCTLDVRWWENS